ncbi:hypothetical protein BDB00DRAFT_869113 [Zychaea mexicana]|uniref:uncharacterized protein n=1 Tax=Zychaea mexicana TaxID=64656 RepID=UPI0022FE5028|nr:uncharacterized protein BDB00DRAFT_869113 [Zychaea mexicana]KAI9496883.1 hypothetical protein BDB00DRAFT_869113 [Zychaea mexicana]
MSSSVLAGTAHYNNSNSQQKSAIYMATDQLLQQVIDLLQHIPDDDAFKRPSTVMPGGTIGKHIRHVYDHFNLLLAGNPQLKNQHQQGQHHHHEDDDELWTVDFDARSREQPMERDRREAACCFRDMQNKFKDIADKVPLDTPVKLAATIDASASVPRALFHSTFDRELWYCCMHAIHHYAAIKAICIENSIPVTSEFGMAPSTTQYQQQQHHHQPQQQQQQRAKMTGHL